VTQEYDYVIVGGGSAGCAIANRLSADPRNSVLLLEAGRRDRNYLFKLPMLMGKLMHSGMYNWDYHTEPEPELNQREIYWPRGKVLGGCSTINGMIYVRGNPADYDGWAAAGCDGWSYQDVLPLFKRSEGHVERDDDFHGTDGPLTVRRARGQNPLFDVFVEAGQQAGYPFTDDFNGAQQEGFGRYDFTIRDGRRCSTATAFIDPIWSRSNLTVKTGAHVRRVIVENGQATGVEIGNSADPVRINARQEVILSAGVISSPHLLMLSGIGDAEHLQQNGIAVEHNLPGVGQNLHDHVDCCLVYECKQPITLYRDLRLDRAALGVAQGALFGTGLISTFPYEAGAFMKSDSSRATPDLQAHFMPATEAAANLHLPNPFSKSSAQKNHGFTIRVGPVTPVSRGSIRLRSGSADDAPRIIANYLSDASDFDKTVNAVQQMRDVIGSKAFDAYRGKEIAPGPMRTTDEQLKNWLRDSSATTLHPVGSCKMGVHADAVVDPQLRVHGIGKLRVADASIMPQICSGNTNAASIMIGEKVSDLILQSA
jgi:choline dehydrogenase